jgi:hypothetical protein
MGEAGAEQMTNEPNMKAAALWYAQKNIPVFPVRWPTGNRCSCGNPDCGNNAAKHPLTAHGFLDATTDPAKVAEWWEKWPLANLAIPTGAASGFLVVDGDPRHGGPAERADLVELFGAVPETAEQITGSGGRHWFFAYSGGKMPATIAPGIDLKGDGGYVLVEPSLSVFGRRYAFDGVEGVKALLHPADVPAWLLDRIKAAKGNSQGKTHAAPVQGKILEGRRNATLASISGTMRRRGVSAEGIEAALLAENRTRCDPPLPQAEVRAIAESVARYEPAGASESPPEDRGPTKAGKKPEPLEAIDARTIFRSDYPEPEFVIDGLLTKGVTFCCGRPKIGKSWLVLQLALAVARGTRALGKFAIRTPGRVIYCGLEEPPRRTSSRLKKFITSDEPYLENIHMVYRLKPLLAGGAAELDEYLTRNPAELLIIDTYLAVLQASSGKDLLRSDYREVKILSELAQKHNVAVLVVHHLRKMPAEYALDAVAGTTGLTASADSIWALTRNAEGTFKLSIQGRDMENRDFELTFGVHDATFGWRITAQGAEIGMSNERKEILLVLEQDAPLTPANIARLLGNKNVNTVRRLIQGLVQDGRVLKGTDRKYRLSSLTPMNGVNEREYVNGERA